MMPGVGGRIPSRRPTRRTDGDPDRRRIPRPDRITRDPRDEETAMTALARPTRHDPKVHAFTDAATGLKAWIAVDDTTLGPAFGGCRLRRYDSDDDAIADARRLAAGMTLKNALAGIPFGGGKAVIARPDAIADREALFEAFGRAVESLGGLYVTAMDSGVDTADMDAIGRATGYVSGRTGHEGAPSPYTARGVVRGIEAAAPLALGREGLAGLRVAIQGVGHVGGALARRLAEAGAELEIADPDAARAEAVAADTGARVVDPDALLARPCDVLAPCGLGGVLDADTVTTLDCRLVAGAANNQLATPEIGRELARRGITYVPDFLINAGGVIHAALAWQGAAEVDVIERVDRIGVTVAGVLQEAERRGLLPVQVALEQAEALIAHRH
jgi:leucine dehydrogenase